VQAGISYRRTGTKRWPGFDPAIFCALGAKIGGL
jgi:hypothetical protein